MGQVLGRAGRPRRLLLHPRLPLQVGRPQVLVELAWWPANNYSGDYGCGFFGTSYNDDPETKATKLNAELANGRLAMLGIAGAMFAEGQTGETLAQQFENLSFSIV